MPSGLDDENPVKTRPVVPAVPPPQQQSVLRMEINDFRGFQKLEKATPVGSMVRQHIYLQMFPTTETARGSF